MIRYAVLTRRSRIEGRGVVAAAAIPRRAKIGEVTGTLISRRQARQRARGRQRIYLVDVSDTHALDCSRGNPLRFLNHSCAPNAFLRIIHCRIEVYARRDIARGEEITVDYGQTPHARGMVCACGQPNCRRRI
jgi:uncharacterized protein